MEIDNNKDGSSSDSNDGHIQPKRPKQIPTYQCNVHSIGTTLGETNYTQMTFPENLKTIQGTPKKGIKTVLIQCMNFLVKTRSITEDANDERMFWLENQAQPLQAQIPHQQSMHFINVFTSKIIDPILKRTNAKTAKICDNAPEELLSKDTFMKETTPTHTFIGLFIYKGFYKLNMFRITRLLSERYGPPIFSAVMY